MHLERRIRRAKLTLLYRCCRHAFERGRVASRADALLWVLREFLELTPYQSATVVEAAHRASCEKQESDDRTALSARWILHQAVRVCEEYDLDSGSLCGGLEFLRAHLAAPELAEGTILDNVRPMVSHLGGLSQALPRVVSHELTTSPRPSWRPGRGLRALALGLALALGMVGVVQAWGEAPARPDITTDACEHRRTLTDLLGREAVSGQDHEAEILVAYQSLFAATPDGPGRRAVREEWAAYLRLRGENS